MTALEWTFKFLLICGLKLVRIRVEENGGKDFSKGRGEKYTESQQMIPFSRES